MKNIYKLKTEYTKDMIKIIHNSGKEELVGYSENSNIIFTNNKGSFGFLNPIKNNSKFNGIYYYDINSKDMIKTINRIDDITDFEENKYEENKENTISYDNLIPIINKKKLIFHNNCVIIKKNLDESTKEKKTKFRINTDIRKIYDFEKWNRNHNIYKKDENTIIIEYSSNNLKFYISFISKEIKFNLIDKWKEESYELDIARKSPPYNLYTYDAIEIEFQENLIIGLGKNLEEATNIPKESYDKINYIFNEILEKNQKNIEKYKLDKKYKIDNKYQREAFLLSINAMESLTVKTKEPDEDILAIFAGLPWFFQFWTRDEAISIGYLNSIKEYEKIKKILLRQLNHILYDGRLPNRFPYSLLGSADGVGIVFHRMYQLIFELKKNNSLYEIFNKDEIIHIKNILDSSLERIKENYLDQNTNLIYNKAKETWMDTDESKINYIDNREGFCIEIQALHVKMLKLKEMLYDILEEKCENESEIFINYVKEKFLLNKISNEINNKSENLKGLIFDRIKKSEEKDLTIRPNTFLAYYFCDDLFTKEQWINNFEIILKELWLDWGGISTISKNSELFCEEYSGQNNHSYHRGDSWFFINNISAIVMNKLNKNKFKKYVDKIIEASTQDILFNGTIGFSSELSSANKLSSHASPAQAWSSSTYIELINETRKSK